jgi:hypothetical protein
MQRADAKENKATVAEPVRYRVPTGQLDAQVFVRRLDGGTHGVVPTIDVRIWKRSPAEVDESAFLPTAAGVTTEEQFAPQLIEAIAAAAGLRVTIAADRVAA